MVRELIAMANSLRDATFKSSYQTPTKKKAGRVETGQRKINIKRCAYLITLSLTVFVLAEEAIVTVYTPLDSSLVFISKDWLPLFTIPL